MTVFLSATTGLAMLLVVGACAGQSPSDSGLALQPVVASQAQTALVGNTLYRRGGGWFDSWQYAGLHAADGTMTGRVWWSDGAEAAQGTWELTGDGVYCRTWQNDWGSGQRGCFALSRDGDILVFDHVSGSRGDADRYVYRLLPGNPHGL